MLLVVENTFCLCLPIKRNSESQILFLERLDILKCTKGEISFNYRTALAIAWARYCKDEIPRVKVSLNTENMKNIVYGTVIVDTETGSEYIVVGQHPYSKKTIVVFDKTKFSVNKDRNKLEPKTITLPDPDDAYSDRYELVE